MASKSDASSEAAVLSNAEAQNAKMGAERAFLTKLLEAALAGQGARVKELVEEYSNEHDDIPPHEVLSQFKDGNGRTALHFACQSTPAAASQNNNSDDDVDDIVSMLLLSKWLPESAVESMVRLKDKDGLTPLMLAAQNPKKDLAERRVGYLLSTGGGAINNSKLCLARSNAGATALHCAAGAGATPSTIQQLCEAAKVPLNTSSSHGGMPLHWAAAEATDDCTQTMRALLDCGADVNALNDRGLPPLVLAVAAGNDVHAKFLVKAGADRSKVLPGGLTVFHMAADLNLVGTLSALIHADDDTDVAGSDQNAMPLAQEYCQRKNDDGETPLDLAAQEGHVGCVMLLLPDGRNDEEAAKACIAKRRAEKTAQKNKKTAPWQAEETPVVPKPVGTTSNIEEENAKQRAAQALATNVSEQDKQRALEHKTKGNVYYSDKKWESAIDSYSAAIDADPTDATFYSNRSACFFMLGRHSEALEDAMVARQLRPDWPKACYRMAVSRMELGRYEDAAVAAWEGLQLDQDNEELKRLLQKCVKKGKKEHQEELAKQTKNNEKQDLPQSGSR